MKAGIPWTLFGAALVTCALLLFKLLDAGIVLDNARSQADRYRTRADLSLRLIQKEWIGRTAERVGELSKELQQSGTTVGTEGSSLEIGDLVFETKEGRVTAVRYLD
jgi:hypothetical protein